MNQSHLVKNGLQCASNRGIWSTSVTNGAFLLAFVTTPIDSATQCIMYAGLVRSAHAHNIEDYGLVMVVDNASGTCWAGSHLQTGMQSPNVRYLYLHVPSLNLVQRERQSVVFWLISPRAYGI